MPKLLIVAIVATILSLGIPKVALAGDEPTFVFVTIPVQISPFERDEKYESPIHEALQDAGLGEVVGGGTQMGPLKPDGSRDVVHVGVDVDLFDFEAGLEVLKETLIELGSPVGTKLEIHLGDQLVELQLSSRGWQVL